MYNYKIAETENFSKKIVLKKYSSIYEKIKNYVYPILKENPFYGPNIKKLKGVYKNVYRYRVGNYRLFYTVSQREIIVFIWDVEARKDAYR
ncbi:MAG: type II toxin-antitoxin system RelE/ParE family toxin [Treponema sp.]|nr:type II toxin-antitoxin system RelE/ParE family toxin [Treponema sp.]